GLYGLGVLAFARGNRLYAFPDRHRGKLWQSGAADIAAALVRARAESCCRGNGFPPRCSKGLVEPRIDVNECIGRPAAYGRHDFSRPATPDTTQHYVDHGINNRDQSWPSRWTKLPVSRSLATRVQLGTTATASM